MKKVLLSFALIAPVLGLVWTWGTTTVFCMWGCSQSFKLFFLNTLFYVLLSSSVWIGYKLFQSMCKAR